MKHKYYLKMFAIIILIFTCTGFDALADNDDNTLEEMEIKGIAFDQRIKSPVVLLSDKKQNSILPIWIGLCEARSIELGLSNVVAPRPLTYDLVAALVRTINAKVERVVIVDLRDEVFYAQVVVSTDGKTSVIDSRPSDAIALASRMKAPIFVKKTVLEKAALLDPEMKKRGL